MQNCLTGPNKHQLTLSRKEQFDAIATEFFSSKENKNCCKTKRNIDTQSPENNSLNYSFSPLYRLNVNGHGYRISC